MLKDKVAIITGGARGIGRSIAEDFLQNNADIVIMDKFFPDDYNSFLEKNKVYGRKIVTKQVDITNLKATETACDEVVAELGKIDILINNAGITRDNLLIKMTEEEWDLVMDVNLKGAFIATRGVTKHMIKQKFGKILNISSVVGLMGNTGQTNYSASKAGLIGFTKSVAKELARRNITCNAIAPGYVETEMTHELKDEQKKIFLDVIPLKRGCKPSEIAGIVAFLASDKANYITGQVIAVDGGMTM